MPSLDFHEVAALPRLAWLAVVERGAAPARAFHRELVVVPPETPSFFRVSAGSLVGAGEGVTCAALRRAPPPVQSYERYRAAVAEALLRLKGNYSSPDRRVPMTAFLTVSSGYDSAAAATLVHDLGIETCFTARRSNSYLPRWLSPSSVVDDGTPIAAALGLDVTALDVRRSQVTEDEIFFLAAGCPQPALAFQSMTRLPERRPGIGVVFTGFQGDEVWDVLWEQPYHRQGTLRGDGAALGLSEIRLKSGFINVAVPALGARRIRDVAALGSASDMEPWRLHDAYDRSVPRRPVATAAILRSG